MRKMKLWMAMGACVMAVSATALTGCGAAPAKETTAVETTAVETTVEATTETVEVNTLHGPGPAELPASADAPIVIWGTAMPSTEENTISINNQSGVSATGEIVLKIQENTLILNAETGFPVQLSDIKEGENMYAYIGQAMTMSLPPQTNAEVIFVQIPADYKVPEYATVTEMQKMAENYNLITTSGHEYQVAFDCEIIPYLTRNMVRLEEVTTDSRCLIWSDEDGNATKIVLFQAE